MPGGLQCQQTHHKEVVVRADAAFAKPEIYEALQERGVNYAIRIPANENLERDIAEMAAAGAAEETASVVPYAGRRVTRSRRLSRPDRSGTFRWMADTPDFESGASATCVALG